MRISTDPIKKNQRVSTFRTLESIFKPKTIAVIGASPTQGTVGNVQFKRIIDFGYDGKIYPVNPRCEEIMGFKTYPRVTKVPSDIDLGIVVVPARVVPEVVEDCVRKGVRGVVVISSGFGERDEKGRKLERELADMVKGTGTRIIGPNCMGVYCPYSRITYDSEFPMEGGNVAFITQSGGLGIAFTMAIAERGLGISKLVSSGNECDLRLTDYLEYFAKDPDTRVIACYVEQVRDGRRFLEVAREITKVKPVVIWKAGRFGAGKRAVRSHTGAIAGSDVIYGAAFKQASVIRACGLEELADFTLISACLGSKKVERVGVVTGPMGIGVSIVDACEGVGLKVPEFSEETKGKLKSILPWYAGVSNPADLTFAVVENPMMYVDSVNVVMEDENIDLVVVGTMFPRDAPHLGIFAQVMAEISKRGKKPLVVVCPFASEGAKKNLKMLTEAGIPFYPTAERAAKSIYALRASSVIATI